MAALEDSQALDVSSYDDVETARTDLRRGVVTAAVVLPAGMDRTLRSGGDVDVAVLADLGNTSQAAALASITGVVADHAQGVQAAQFATSRAGGTFDENLRLAVRVSGATSPLGVELDAAALRGRMG